jgi:hypothetical protein
MVGDVSNLTAPLLPPLAWYGGYVIGAAGERGGFSVQSNGPGGCYIREWRFNTSNGIVAFNVTAAEQFSGYSTLCPASNMAPQPCSALVQMGSMVAASPADWPRISCLTNTSVGLTDSVYLPRGYWFSVQAAPLAASINFACLVQDVPAMASEA